MASKYHNHDCSAHGKGARKANTTHGHTTGYGPSRTYNSWASMVQRTTNPNASKYPVYGGRGIIVDERWLKFENFLADMGERPVGMTLDRINSDGDYTPENTRWATIKTQNLNRRGWA